MYVERLEEMGYTVITSGREKEDNYDTGLIAFKSDKFTFRHFEKVDYSQFFSEFNQMAKETQGFEMRYAY